MRISVHGSRPGIPNPRPLTSGLHSLRVHGSCSIHSPYSQHILWDKSSQHTMQGCCPLRLRKCLWLLLPL